MEYLKKRLNGNEWDDVAVEEIFSIKLHFAWVAFQQVEYRGATLFKVILIETLEDATGPNDGWVTKVVSRTFPAKKSPEVSGHLKEVLHNDGVVLVGILP